MNPDVLTPLEAKNHIFRDMSVGCQKTRLVMNSGLFLTVHRWSINWFYVDCISSWAEKKNLNIILTKSPFWYKIRKNYTINWILYKKSFLIFFRVLHIFCNIEKINIPLLFFVVFVETNTMFYKLQYWTRNANI